MDEIILIVGKRIRNYRLQLGLSQEQLAEKAGCHASYIGQIERGEKNATLESIHKIAVALHVSLSSLFEKLDDADASTSYPSRCYELIAAKKASEQACLYHILSEIERYKNYP